MKRIVAASLLLLAPMCLAGPKDSKLAKFMPPAESHGKTIMGYGCDKEQVSGMPTSPTSGAYWSLVVWAQYGKEHKRYWQKTFGTYQVPLSHSVNSSGESAASGGAIGAYSTEFYDFSSMNKICQDWGAQVKSRLKVEPNEGEKKP